MTTYARRAPTKGDVLAAAATSLVVAAGVGAATYYLTRILLSRDELRSGPSTAMAPEGRRRIVSASASDQESRDARGD